MRIVNLLNIVGLNDRFINRNSDFSFHNQDVRTDWKVIDELLNKKRLEDLKLFDDFFGNQSKV